MKYSPYSEVLVAPLKAGLKLPHSKTLSRIKFQHASDVAKRGVPGFGTGSSFIPPSYIHTSILHFLAIICLHSFHFFLPSQLFFCFKQNFSRANSAKSANEIMRVRVEFFFMIMYLMKCHMVVY